MKNMSKWKYLGGDFGAADTSQRPCVISIDMMLGVIVIQSLLSTFTQRKSYSIPAQSLESISTISQSQADDKGTQALLAGAGFLVAGPLGILAGLAAKKKDQVGFVARIKDEETVDESIRGKKFVAITNLKNYQKLLSFSGLTEAPLARLGQDQSGSAVNSIGDQLKTLCDLKEKGLLTQDEFEKAKAKIVNP